MAIIEEDGPVRQKGVPRGIAEAEKAAEELQQHVESLAVSLGSALRPEGPSVEQERVTAAVPQDPGCHYEGQLRCLRDSLAATDQRVTELIKRLEA